MRSLRQKRYSAMRRTFGLRVLSVFLLVVLFFMVRSGINVYKKERETQENRNMAELEFAELEGRKTELQKEVIKLKTDRGVEEELRSQFEIGHEGESMLVIVDRPVVEDLKEEEEVWWKTMLPWGR